MVQFINRKSKRLIGQIKRLLGFAFRMDISPRSLILPALIGLAVAVLEGVYVALFYPIMKGLIYRDFTAVYNIRGFGFLIKSLPSWFLETNARMFCLIIVILLVVLLIKTIGKYLSVVMVAHRVKIFTHNLRTEVFARYLTFGKMFFDKTENARLYAILMTFTGSVGQKLISFQNMFISLLTLLMYVIIMVFLSWQLTLVLLLGFPLLNLMSKGLIKKIALSSQHATERLIALGKRGFDVLLCMPLVKVNAREDAEKKKFRYDSNESRKLEFSVSKKELLVPPLNEILQNIMLLVILVSIVMLVQNKGLQEAAKFMVFFILVRRSAVHMGVYNQFRSQLAAVASPIKQIREIFNDEDKFRVHSGNETFKGLQDHIEIKSLDFSYDEDVPVLNNVGFTAHKGEMIAIVGPTGSGKTTLIDLLLRFYDCPSGAIFLDGTDIREFSIQSLMAHMSLVSQNTYVLNETLRNNISYGIDHPSEEDIEKAIEKAQLKDLIQKLPKGLETVVGDQGVRLSGGEKQRVSLARALLKSSEILILDEATSSLDSQTEKLVQKAIDAAVEGRTTLVIAHRLSTIKHANKILVLEEGKITEQGTLEELLAAKGKFHQLWEEQKFF